jgi:flagellar biosynthesis protein FlhG
LENSLGIEKQFFAIASGKGGTGKSTFAINFSIALAALGYDVILVDADLGGADVSNLLGIRQPNYTLRDFIEGDVNNLQDVLEPTPSPRLHLIAGGSDIISIANPRYQQKMKLIRSISALQADFIVADLGPDIHYNNLDFFNSAPVGFLVTQNVDPILLGFYRFLKAAFVRRLKQEFREEPEIVNIINKFQNQDWSSNRNNLYEAIRAANEDIESRLDNLLESFQPKLVFNMVESDAVRKTANHMFSFVLASFGFRLQTVGLIPRDRDVERAYGQGESYLLRYPHCRASKAMFDLLVACGLNTAATGERVDNFSQFSRFLKVETPAWEEAVD